MTPADAVSHGDAGLPSAQSTVRLFEQLRYRDLPESDLQRVRAACAAALELFAGRMHACGKPYVAHCTGAAGILVALGAEADLIIAGLLHGAYRWGDFGPWRVLLPLQRRHLRRRFGARVEQYVFAFFTMPWGTGAVRGLVGDLAGLDPLRRAVVLMRLVSDLDSLRGRSHLYRADAEPARESLRLRGPILVQLADQLGFPALSRALATAVADTLTGSAVAPELRSDLATGVLLAPASSRLRLDARLANAIAGALRRLRQALQR
jgi:hypothetical protein